MTEEKSPTFSRNKWSYVGCAVVILMIIGLFLLIFWLGTESANPWGQAPGPGP